MASAREIHVQSDNLTECGICLGLINDPKALPCLHVFCTGCLEEWTKEQADKTQVKCPVCKEDFKLSQEGGSGLHFFLSTLKEKEVLQSSLKKEKLCCTSCYESDNIAISWCLHCSAKLCEHCVTCHKMLKLFEGHKLYALDDIRTDKVDVKKVEIKRFCKKHEDQIPRFFCETCGVLICRDCTVVDHPMTKHTLVNVEEISGEQLNMVTDLTNRCQSVASDVDDEINEVISAQKDLEKALKKAHAEADRFVQRIKDDFLTKLEKQRQKIADNINEWGQRANVILIEEKDKLEKQRLQFSRALTFSKSLCENGSPYDLAAVFTPLTDTMTRLSDLKLDGVQKDLSEVMFVPDDDYAIQVPPFGYVTDMNRTPAYQDMSGDWELERKLAEGTFNNGLGIATSSHKHHFAVACDDKTEQAKLFDTNGNFLSQINGTDFTIFKPRSVAITYDDYLILTDQSESVKTFDGKLNPVHEFKTIPPNTVTNSNSSLSGLAVTDNHLYVSDITNKYISVHKAREQHVHVRSFNVNNIIPWFMSISPNGKILVVSDVDNLQIINSFDGQILHTFPKSVTPLPGTTGSLFNGNNEFIIARQGRFGSPGIYRYGIDGKYLGCITADVDNPTGVLITEDGKLVVLEWTHIKVFKRT